MPDLIGHPFPTKKQPTHPGRLLFSGFFAPSRRMQAGDLLVSTEISRLGRPKGSSRKFDRVMAEMESILSELQDGASMTSVAKRYGVNRNTLRRYLSRMQQPESPYI